MMGVHTSYLNKKNKKLASHVGYSILFCIFAAINETENAITQRNMAGNLHISDKLLASKQASKQASKCLYIIIGIVRVMARRHHSSCAVVRHTLVPCGSASFFWGGGDKHIG